MRILRGTPELTIEMRIIIICAQDTNCNRDSFMDVFSTTSYTLRRSVAVIVGLILVAVSTERAMASESYWADIGKKISTHIENAESLYADGDSKGARRAVIQAYFGEFEDKKMEAAMRVELGAKHTYEVERLFGDLRKAIKNGADTAVIAESATAIHTAIKRDAIALDKAGITPEVFAVNQ